MEHAQRLALGQWFTPPGVARIALALALPEPPQNRRRDQLEGKIQERYGYAKDQARKEVDEWSKAQE